MKLKQVRPEINFNFKVGTRLQEAVNVEVVFPGNRTGV